MAEDLTEYLNEHGARVRYLHSDIDTVERSQLIRALRLGEFDALVGINLLREGLDIPEVSLVAILDADKEGFLRSEGALIQTIGRAARNLNGRAIRYADRVTGSMQRAVDETERRRKKQQAYNEEHGITPQGIRKAVRDVMEGAYGEHGTKVSALSKVAEERTRYQRMSGRERERKLAALEKQMYERARNLEFEQAAAIRDEINKIRELAYGPGIEEAAS